ncbi:hypothetical protein BDZ89DRAFT_1058044 [Hymenopellis radicata]|nr:hypothetical protein BDZ89DRAFT_1058044 [Hymenopellis radicata]
MNNIDDTLFRSLVPEETWCLIDSNNQLTSVPVYLVDSRRFVIQAASPRIRRMEWMQKVPHSQYFLMKPWDCSELIAARQCQTKLDQTADETQLANFHHLCGGSARDAYSFAYRMAAFESKIESALDDLERDAMARLRSHEPSSFVPESTSHRLLSFFPVTNQKRTVWKIDSPSESLRDRLWSRMAKDYEEAQREWFYFNLCSKSPGPRALAARMFDGIYHTHITKGGYWPLRRMVVNENRTPSIKQTVRGYRTVEDAPKVLVASKEICIKEDRDPSTSPVLVSERTFLKWSVDEPFLVGVYYHPQPRNFATFDSFFVDRTGHAIAFQASIANSHSVSPVGQAWLKDRGINKVTYVYVSPTPAPASVTLPLEVNSDLNGFYDGVYHMHLNYGCIDVVES